MIELIKEANIHHEDTEIVRNIQQGFFKMRGDWGVSGYGSLIEQSCVKKMAAENEILRPFDEALAWFQQTYKPFKDAALREELYNQTMSDVSKGRITGPLDFSRFRGERVIISLRFPLKQGDSYRCCDDLTASGLNAIGYSQEKVLFDGTDSFVDVWKVISECVDSGEDILAFKEDIEGAYRFLPVRYEDRNCLLFGVHHPTSGKLLLFQHESCCFGATASVHSWHRFGRVLASIMRRLFSVPVIRWVDDFINAEGRATIHSAHDTFKEVLDLLGVPRKRIKSVPPTSRLDVLGTDTRLARRSLKMIITQSRADSVKQLCSEALASGYLRSAVAGKLAGKVASFCSATYGKVMRAFTNPLYQRQHAKGGEYVVDDRLRIVLTWLVGAMSSVEDLCRRVDLSVRRQRLVSFTDAEGTGSLCGILVKLNVDGSIAWVKYWTYQVDQSFEDALLDRETQIGIFETVAICVQVATFEREFKNSDVDLFVDSEVAKSVLIKGYSSRVDYCCLAGAFWRRMLRLSCSPFLWRVTSKSNISDAGSRGDCSLYQELGWERVTAVCPKEVKTKCVDFGMLEQVWSEL